MFLIDMPRDTPIRSEGLVAARFRAEYPGRWAVRVLLTDMFVKPLSARIRLPATRLWAGERDWLGRFGRVILLDMGLKIVLLCIRPVAARLRAENPIWMRLCNVLHQVARLGKRLVAA